MSTTNCDFTISIHAARINKEMSRETLAELVNVSPATIKNYELGKTKPDADTFLQIAKITGTPLDFLRP